MRKWQVQEAKARFSELLEASISEGPQMVTRRGVPAAVLVPAETWQKMEQSRRPTLKDWLLSDENRFDLELPKRGRLKRRPIPDLED
jgi:prevent-host-death family protein